MELIQHSPDLVEPDCPYFGVCGGCTYRHISYEAELRLKEDLVRDAFSRLGGIFTEVSPIVGSKRTEGYRNKAQYPVGRNKEGEIVAGFYAKRSHRIIPSTECALQPAVFGEIQAAVLDFMREKQIPPYDETTGEGLIRHLYLRRGEVTGEIMLCLVAASLEIPHIKEFVCQMTERFPAIQSIVLNENSSRDNVILGKYCRTIWGRDTIRDILCGVEVELSPLSFYQVNHPQAEVLYRKAMEYAGLTGTEILLDLYCGAGTIGLSGADRVRQLIGVEVIPEAIENAKRNAERNGTKNARFLCADAGEAAALLAEEGLLPDVIILDPPRKGVDQQVIDAVEKMSPECLVMVSCNPATAARDCALLREKGYEIRAITPVDLFPRTGHVETVVLLSKGEIDSQKVRVEFSLEDMDMSDFKKGATYSEIKAYVLEKFGLKVSSLYISQVKRKCGLEVGQNYNLPKSENQRVPQCPLEKEKAIMDALRHFKVTL